MYREEPKEVSLVIKSHEVSFDGTSSEENNETKLCNAVCYEKGSKIYLKYEDTEEGITTTTMIVVTPEEVVIRRTGGVGSRMQFRKNLTYSFLYHTGFGDVPLTISTREFETDIQSEAIKIHLAYDIASQGEVVSSHRIQLEARVK